jgi:hypothetical protein
MCANLLAMAAHLTATGKPTAPFDALAVCHVAGCSRVTGAVTGVPASGEAGCAAHCAATVRQYIEQIHKWVATLTPAVPSNIRTTGQRPSAWTGPQAGCTMPDPTGTGGCVTPATAWLVGQVASNFGDLAVSCWDAHAWNPRSDHARGRACDYTFGPIGRFPDGDLVEQGWAMAEWLRGHAAALHVNYVIWQGRIWSSGRADAGWRPYTGGGVYDPTDPTGGHYDHIHVSIKE